MKCAHCDRHLDKVSTVPVEQAARMLTDEEIAVLSMQTWGCASIAPRLAPTFARAAIEAFCRINNIKIGESNG